MKQGIINLIILLLTLLTFVISGCTKPGWVIQESSTTNNLRSLWFTDTKTGTVVGDHGTILRTTNGGDKWTIQICGTEENLWGVRFIDSMNGWVVGDNGTILHTTNGGTTWILQKRRTENNLYSILCLDDQTIWIAGSDGTILHSINEGASWIREATGVINLIWDVFFISQDTGIAGCGGCIDCPYYGGYILRTTNSGFILYHSEWDKDISGAIWNIQKYDTTIMSIYGAYYTDANTGIVVGIGGNILKTVDGGITWTGQKSGTTYDLLNVFFTDAETGIAFGGRYIGQYQEGIILRTTNSGST